MQAPDLNHTILIDRGKSFKYAFSQYARCESNLVSLVERYVCANRVKYVLTIICFVYKALIPTIQFCLTMILRDVWTSFKRVRALWKLIIAPKINIMSRTDLLCRMKPRFKNRALDSIVRLCCYELLRNLRFCLPTYLSLSLRFNSQKLEKQQLQRLQCHTQSDNSAKFYFCCRKSAKKLLKSVSLIM